VRVFACVLLMVFSFIVASDFPSHTVFTRPFSNECRYNSIMSNSHESPHGRILICFGKFSARTLHTG